jgi:hypothetical protein
MHFYDNLTSYVIQRFPTKQTANLARSNSTSETPAVPFAGVDSGQAVFPFGHPTTSQSKQETSGSGGRAVAAKYSPCPARWGRQAVFPFGFRFRRFNDHERDRQRYQSVVTGSANR